MQAQQKFNVQNGTKTEFYDGLEEAIQKAASGDTIYLPGGVIQVQNDLIIDKKLALIGAGWDVDSIGGLMKTDLRKNGSYNVTINFREGSDGSLLMGCELSSVSFGHRDQFNDDHQNIQNITIWRNKCNSVALGVGVGVGVNNVRNIFIKENYIPQIYSYSASNCWINNNVIHGVISGLNDSHIYNNVIIQIQDMNECIFENNFIINGVGNYCNNSTFAHNAFATIVNFPNGTNTGINNLVEQGTIYTFQVDNLSFPKNLVIRDTSPCKNAGTDGTDIGIFGGSTPFKSRPFNPHIDKAIISSQTDKEGILKVEITATAQDR